MKKTKNLSKKAIFTATAVSMLFTGCSYLDDMLKPHDPGDDHPIQASSASMQSSSSVMAPYSLFETWYGAELTEQIITGLGNDTETSGYWFHFDDAADGGQSRIVWPVALGNEYNDESMLPVIEACNGICGTFILDEGSMPYQPFVGLGFNLVGERSMSDPTPEAGDASSMGGVCVTYTSDIPIGIQMGLGYDVDAAIGYAFPEATLPKSPAGTTKHIAWSDFKQPAWYKGDVKFTGEQAASQLVNLRFMFQAADGTTGKFNIMAVGPYDGCTQTSVNPPDPIDPPNPPTPPTGTFQTWFGYNGDYQVITGHDNGTETSGYWFTYDDEMDGGRSTIVWPVLIGNEYNTDALDPVIDYCGGICGTASLDKGNLMYSPFVGLGFLVAGETSATDLTPATTDASDMGGVCITYSSEIAPVLEMSLGDEMDATIEYALPVAALPKSVAGTTKFLKWSDFKQPTWYKGSTKINGEQASKMLSALRFRLQAAPGSYAFNIQAIGPYNGGTCTGAPVVTNNKKKRH
jgi:hypothetical protein